MILKYFKKKPPHLSLLKEMTRPSMEVTILQHCLKAVKFWIAVSRNVASNKKFFAQVWSYLSNKLCFFRFLVHFDRGKIDETSSNFNFLLLFTAEVVFYFNLLCPLTLFLSIHSCWLKLNWLIPLSWPMKILYRQDNCNSTRRPVFEDFRGKTWWSFNPFQSLKCPKMLVWMPVWTVKYYGIVNFYINKIPCL